jgi:hypothetical protein
MPLSRPTARNRLFCSLVFLGAVACITLAIYFTIDPQRGRAGRSLMTQGQGFLVIILGLSAIAAGIMFTVGIMF